MKNIVIKSFAVLLSLSLAAIAEHYFERLWVITMPSAIERFTTDQRRFSPQFSFSSAWQ